MPTIPQQQTIVQYIANSAQTQYTFAFYAPLPTDIQVYYQSSTATPIPSADILAINSQYTVTYNADPTTGGFITLLFTPTTGFYLTINRQVAASLTTNFSNAQNFNGANLDAALDRLLLLCQQNQNYALQRNLSYIINTYLPNASPFTQLPPLAQNQIWIGSASGIVAAQLAASPSASVLQSMLANNSPGTDGARLVGYYDSINASPTTVDAYLGFLNNNITNNSIYGQDTSVSANTLTVTLPSGYQLLNGNLLELRVANTNTGNTTLSVNGGTAHQVVKFSNTGGNYTALTGGELSGSGTIGGGAIYLFMYDLHYNLWILVNPNPNTTNYFYGASVYLAGTQVVGAGSTLIQFDTVDYDPFNIFFSVPNYFAPTRPGYYTITGVIQVTPINLNGTVAINIYKNSSLWVSLNEVRPTGAVIMNGSFTMYLNGTDFVQLAFANATGANVSLVSGGFFNNFQITYQGA